MGTEPVLMEHLQLTWLADRGDVPIIEISYMWLYTTNEQLSPSQVIHTFLHICREHVARFKIWHINSLMASISEDMVRQRSLWIKTWNRKMHLKFRKSYRPNIFHLTDLRKCIFFSYFCSFFKIETLYVFRKKPLLNISNLQKSQFCKNMTFACIFTCCSKWSLPIVRPVCGVWSHMAPQIKQVALFWIPCSLIWTPDVMQKRSELPYMYSQLRPGIKHMKKKMWWAYNWQL